MRDWSRGALARRFSRCRDAGGLVEQRLTPFQRMTQCRDALTKLDNKGWNRSYHQRLFHEDFLVRGGGGK